jgi:4-hydroxyphenylacetate 3-monooxygenase
MALRTGSDYIAALRDGRKVFSDGRVIEDVTANEGMRTVIDSFAKVYDRQHTDEYRDRLTFEGADGERHGGSWFLPHDSQELAWRRELTQTIARLTGGLFGRQIDYVPTFFIGMLDVIEQFSQGNDAWANNLRNYVADAQARDLSLAHAFVTQQSDPKLPIDETDVPRIVDETADGVVVRGAWTIATFAPYADECLFGTFPRPGLRDEHVLYFALPLNTPGLRIVARSVYGTGDEHDHPVSRIGDENDSIIICHDVLVPHERIFSRGDAGFAARTFPLVTEWAHWSILCRFLVKAQLLAGLVATIPELTGRASLPFSQECLGEALRYVKTVEAFLIASEARGRTTEAGFFMPDPMLVTAGRAYSVEHYRRIAGLIQDLGSQSLINSPSVASLENDEIGPVLNRIYGSAGLTAHESTQLFRLAWDVVGSSFGGRQTLFELFNALPWTAQRSQIVARTDVEPFRRFARVTAGLESADEAVDLFADGIPVDYKAVGREYELKTAVRSPS